MSKECKAAEPTFLIGLAKIVWCSEDIQGFKPDWTLEQCEDWLYNNCKRIIDRSVEFRHEVIETLLEIEDE